MACAGGTSMAAPHVAGVAAMLLEAMGKETAQMRPISVKAAIVNSARDLGEDRYAQGGYGLVRADNAVKGIRSSVNAQQIQQPESLVDSLIKAFPAAIMFGGLMSVLSGAASRSNTSRDSLVTLIRDLFRSGRITLNDLYSLRNKGGILTEEDLRRILS